MQTQGQNLYEASRQWASRPADQRFKTLAELREAVHNRRLRSRSVDVDLGTVTAREEAGTITLNRGLSSVEPTHWSFGQLSGWVHAPAEYLRRLSLPLAVQCLNEGIRGAADERGALKFMAITRDEAQGDGPNVLQAVTSTTYGRIWDADVVDGVCRIQERNPKWHNPPAYSRGGGAPEPSGLYASDHDVFMFLIDGGSLLEAGPRAELNRGFITWNSETGARAWDGLFFMFNRVCGNHIIWGAQDIQRFRIIHRSGAPARFDADAMPALEAYCSASAAPELATIKAAQGYLLPDREPDKIVEWLRGKGKFSRNECLEAIDTAKREEGDCRTLWQLVAGLTAYARGFDYVDTRVDLETRAGKLLELARAKTVVPVTVAV